MSSGPGTFATATAQRVLGVLLGVMLLAVVPGILWPSCRELFDVSGGATEFERFARKVEASALAALCSSAAVVSLSVWLRPAVPLRPLAVVPALRSCVLCLPAWLLLLAGYLWLLPELGISVAAQEPLRYCAGTSVGKPAFWLVVAAAVLGAPVAEELIFRGGLQPLLQEYLGRVAGRAATAVLFGLAHGGAFALPIAVLGWFLGGLVQRHGSLFPAMLAHALNNLLTVVVVVVWPPLLDSLYPG